MTKDKKSPYIKEGLTRGQMLFCIMSLSAIVLTFMLSEVAIEAMKSGMRLCVNTVIPALFPFMVFSELMIASGAAELVGKYLGVPLSRLFVISKEGSTALLLGLACGFPIGSRSAISLYEKGRIDRGELEHLLMFCNLPSSAFLISAVGVSLFGSKDFGVLLYCSHLLSALLLGLVGRCLFAKKKREPSCCKKADTGRSRQGIASALTEAVSDSAGSMLMICAFVIFFSAVVGYLRYFAEKAELPRELTALMFGFFEMTGGIGAAAELPLWRALGITAAISGWSGLSVAFQFVGICKEYRISLRPYFLSKVCTAVLNFIFVTVYMRLWGDGISFGESGSISSMLTVKSPLLWAVIVAVFIGGCAALKAKRKKA